MQGDGCGAELTLISWIPTGLLGEEKPENALLRQVLPGS
jgi:hypothetical protein